MAFENTIDKYGDKTAMAMVIEKTIDEYCDDSATKIASYAFYKCTALTKVDVPNAVSVGEYAFCGCTALVDVDLPNVTELKANAFNSCNSLTSIYFPKVTAIDNYVFRECKYVTDVCFPKATHTGYTAFQQCERLKKADFPVATEVSYGCFEMCRSLVALILRSETLCVINDGWQFNACDHFKGTKHATFNPNSLKDGYVYVPRALVEQYQVATNWVQLDADRFRALEDYTVDGTASGSLNWCTGVTLDRTTLTFDDPRSQTLTATLINPSPLGLDSAEWESADPTIATVHNGVVTPLNVGTTVITATCNGHSATCEVTVNSIEYIADSSHLYRLARPTAFNGTSDYIDTGITLFDTAKDFTIICEANFSKLANNICLFHCMNESTPYPGLSVDGNSGVHICYTGSSSLTTSITDKNAVSALAFRYVNGKMDAIRYKNTSGAIVKHTISGTPTYTKVTQNLLLGADQTTAGAKGRFFAGTISRFDVYNTALADDAIDALL